MNRTRRDYLADIYSALEDLWCDDISEKVYNREVENAWQLYNPFYEAIYADLEYYFAPRHMSSKEIDEYMEVHEDLIEDLYNNSDVPDDIIHSWVEDNDYESIELEIFKMYIDTGIQNYISRISDTVFEILSEMEAEDGEELNEENDVEIESQEEDYDEGFGDIEESTEKHKRRLYY